MGGPSSSPSLPESIRTVLSLISSLRASRRGPWTSARSELPNPAYRLHCPCPCSVALLDEDAVLLPDGSFVELPADAFTDELDLAA